VFLVGGIVAELLFVSALFLVPTLESESFEHAFAILRRFAFASGVIGILSSAWPQMVSLEGKLTPNDALLIRRAWENRRNTDEVWRQIELNDEINQLAQSERYAEAAVVLERMLKSDPRNTAHIATLAALHAAAGNCDQAMLCHRDIIGHTASKSLERVRAIDAAATLALQMGNRDELARMHPLVEEALQIAAQPTVKGTLGSLLVELDDTMAGVKLLNECLAESEADHDRAIANAYLAKAALRMGRKQHAVRLLMFAKSTGGDLPLVQRIAGELEPQLQNAVDDPQLELR
jgi:tetratricopeptide (TPR) repeat protein